MFPSVSGGGSEYFFIFIFMFSAAVEFSCSADVEPQSLAAKEIQLRCDWTTGQLYSTAVPSEADSHSSTAHCLQKVKIIRK